MIKVVELFAGIGGFRYGLERVQLENENIHESTSEIRNKEGQSEQFSNGSDERLFNCIWSNDNNKYACQIYRKNFGGEELYEGDITKIETKNIPDHDLLTGGFPCQAFSIAGKRLGFDDTRGTLFFEIARILRDKTPRYFLLENVRGLLSHNNGQTFQTILEVLSDIGYVLQWEVLNSKNYGVPQNRERVFIIGHLRGISRPEVFPIRGISQEDHRSTGEDVSYAIDSNYYKGTNNITDGRRQLVGINQLNQPKHSFNRIYGTDGIAPAFRSASGNKAAKVLLKSSIRRLIPTECERLQGFPDGWTESVSDTQRYKMLGNAVTTKVITAIGERLLCSINAKTAN